MPVFFFAEPLAVLRPNAKVFLSQRDSVDQWYQSFIFITTLFEPFLYCRPWIWFMPDLKFNVPIIKLILGLDVIDLKDDPRYVSRVLPWYDTIHTHPNESDDSIRRYWMTAYTEFAHTIVERIPADRLLVFNVKQGWGASRAIFGNPCKYF